MTNATFEGEDGSKRSTTSQASSSQAPSSAQAPAQASTDAASVGSKASGEERRLRRVSGETSPGSFPIPSRLVDAIERIAAAFEESSCPEWNLGVYLRQRLPSEGFPIEP